MGCVITIVPYINYRDSNYAHCTCKLECLKIACVNACVCTKVEAMVQAACAPMSEAACESVYDQCSV